MTTITATASDEFSGYLIGKDVVEAGDIARELRKSHSTTEFGKGTGASFVKNVVNAGGSFYTGNEAQKIAPFCVREPSFTFFCLLPDQWKKTTENWHQVSETQYHFGVYLLKPKERMQTV